ncbi:unnamed protein product, partial [Phaeothamnion confervicola]
AATAGAAATDNFEADLPPAEGWVRVPSREREGGISYENIWTGERVAERPRAPA